MNERNDKKYFQSQILVSFLSTDFLSTGNIKTQCGMNSLLTHCIIWPNLKENVWKLFL